MWEKVRDVSVIAEYLWKRPKNDDGVFDLTGLAPRAD